MIKPSVSLFLNLREDKAEFSVLLEEVTQSKYKRHISVASRDISLIGTDVLNFLYVN
jgi:hypothetical protein